MSKQSQEIYRITLYVAGVKKRCRTPDRHRHKLGVMHKYALMNQDGTCNEFKIQELIAKAHDWIDANMKSIAQRPYLDFQREVLTIEDGFESVQWEPFGHGHFKKEFEVL